MDKTWIGYNLETFSGGVSSAVFPDLLPNNQVAWGLNADFRGSKIHTRPNIAQRMFLPRGLVQGLGYFNIQGGMLIVVIAGIPYRIRIGIRPGDFSYEQIFLPWYNSPIIKQVWMVQTPETFIIQDGQSQPILYDGSTARRSDPAVPEVPIGLMMAYGNGRLWVAVQGNQLVAGDIRTSDAGSELKFTETQYLSGGGTLSFSDTITGLGFIPTTGVTDYGALLVFGRNFLDTVRADITQRDAWASYPGFVTNAMRNVGTPSGWSLVQVNQDLFWRDALGGIRSINTIISNANNAQYRGAPVNSNVSISREVSRLVDFDSQQILRFSSGIYFDNRLLVTSSPFLNLQGGVSHRDLISLDFSPVSMMQGQSPAAYNGTWQGVNWTKLVTGEFGQMTRAFGVSSDEDGNNRLWEFETQNIDDIYITDGSSISDGTASILQIENKIESFIEYPRIDFNDPKKRKRLTRCDVWLSNISEEVDLTAYWRPDNNQKWQIWDSVSECATMTDPSTTTPHVWKNLLPEQRPLIKSFSIPDTEDELSTYYLSTGFGFQIRLKWTGSLRIERVVLWATVVDDTDYVIREGQEPECKPNDVTGNEIRYEIPLGPTGIVATPVFDPSSGFHASTTLSTATAGATIRYTTDGSLPTKTHGTIYTAAITITDNVTIKAIAYHIGMLDSEIASADFNITCTGSSDWDTWKSTIENEGGTYDSTSLEIACNLSSQLNLRSYSSKILYLLPLLGTDIIAARVPLRDSLNAGIADNSGFSDADFDQAIGLRSTGAKHLSTRIAPSDLGGITKNGGIGWWEGSFVNQINSESMGSDRQDIILDRRFTIDLRDYEVFFNWGDTTFSAVSSQTATKANYYGQRSSDSLREIYVNGSLAGSDTTTDDPDITSGIGDIILFGQIENKITIQNYSGLCLVSYLTDGTLTPSEIADFHDLLTNYLIVPTGRNQPAQNTTEALIWKDNVSSVGGTLASDSFTIANNLSKQIYQKSYSPKIQYLMPLLGSNLLASTVPLRDRLEHGPVTNHGFLNSDFSQSGGLSNVTAATKYFECGFKPIDLGKLVVNLSVPSTEKAGFGWWELGIGFGSAVEPVGCYNIGDTQRFVFDLRSTLQAFRYGNAGNSAQQNSTAGNFHYYGQRASAVLRELYKSGISIASNTTSDSASGSVDRFIWIMSSNNGSPDYWNGICGLVYFTNGEMTSSEVLDFHNLLQAYLITPTGR